MARVETIGDCRLYLGDCAEILKTLEPVQAVVTDPPYGINYGGLIRNRGDGNGGADRNGWKSYGGPSWDEKRPPRETFDRLREISEQQIIWGGNYFADMLPPTMRWLVWDKGQRDFSLADCELAWTSEERAARIFAFPRGKALLDGKQHPTQKPIELMKWCLSFVGGTGVVLDPFMGSGTTGVACAKVGRRFVGIEIDEGYFEIACERIRKAYQQPDLFVAPDKKAEPEQLSLGGGDE